MADKPQTRSQYRNKQSGGSKKKSQKRGKRVAANIFKTIFFVGLFLVFLWYCGWCNCLLRLRKRRTKTDRLQATRSAFI